MGAAIATGLLILGVVVAAFFAGRYFFNPVAKKIEPKRRWVDNIQLNGLVKQEIHRHAEYEKDRVDNRRRPGWHPDLRNVAIAQRVMRELHRLGLEAEYKEVLSRVVLEIQ